MPTHLIYPYKFSGPRTDEILRYSIRSACEHIGNVWQVTIIGDVPEWFCGRGIRHPSGPTKYENACERYWLASQLVYKEGEKLVVMHDDIVLTKPWDRRLYDRGPLRDRLSHYKGEYGRVARNTLSLLEGLGVPNPRDFGLHMPLPCELRDLREVAGTYLGRGKEPVLFRSVLCNLAAYKSTKADDCKAFRPEQVTQLLETSPVISTSENGPATEALLTYCRLRFTVPSVFEQGVY